VASSAWPSELRQQALAVMLPTVNPVSPLKARRYSYRSRPTSFPVSQIKILLLEGISSSAVDIFRAEGFDVVRRAALQERASAVLLAPLAPQCCCTLCQKPPQRRVENDLCHQRPARLAGDLSASAQARKRKSSVVRPRGK